MLQVRANNNAVYEKLFWVERTRGRRRGRSRGPGSVTLREAAGDCRLVLDAPTREASMRRAAPRDLASCADPFDVQPFLALLDAAGLAAVAGGGDGGRTGCEAVADDPGAFPVRY